MKIDTGWYKGFCNPEDISIKVLEPGDVLRVKGRLMECEGTPTAFILDRAVPGEDAWNNPILVAANIRQQLDLPDNNTPVRQDRTEPNKRLREHARSFGYPKVTVAGGIPPLVIKGTVAVPDFKMSGTSWYIVPMDVAEAFEAEIVRFNPEEV